jgi:hypothetical protein
MRFIINFFIFGFIFYLIYIFFPDAFQTLTSWAGHVYDFFRGIVQMIVERYNEWKGVPAAPSTPVEPQKVMSFLLDAFRS